MQVKKNIKILGEFIGHLVIGAAMFVALLVFGGGLNALVRWVGPLVGDESFAELMKLVEQLIIYSDIAFLLWWTIFSTYKAIKEMTNE